MEANDSHIWWGWVHLACGAATLSVASFSCSRFWRSKERHWSVSTKLPCGSLKTALFYCGMTIAIQTLQPMQCSASVQSALLNKSLQNKIPVASRSMPIVCILVNTTDTSISICHSCLSFSRILLFSSLCLRQESQQRNNKRTAKELSHSKKIPLLDSASILWLPFSNCATE